MLNETRAARSATGVKWSSRAAATSRLATVAGMLWLGEIQALSSQKAC